MPTGELVDGPGRHGRLLELLEPRGPLLVALLAHADRSFVPRAGELLEGKTVEPFDLF
jgi:hypothetical protein